MRVVIVSLHYDKQTASEEDLMEQHYTLTGWAEAVQQQAVETITISRFHKNSIVHKNNVSHYFVKDRLGSRLRSWQIPLSVLKKIRSLDPDVIHLHNFSLFLLPRLLRLFIRKKTAIIIQHHGGKQPSRLKRGFYNRFNSVADQFFFTTIQQGREWLMKEKLFPKIRAVMEGATFFDYNSRDIQGSTVYSDRAEARTKTGINGERVFLWVGRLDQNKDPLVVLDGFEILLMQNTSLQLYMIFSDGVLLPEVEKKIAASEILKPKVHLPGKIDHGQIELYYKSADYFVLGSHYEGSGYALSEALRCGCVPVITDIPSFRMMTDNGRLGALWEAGHKDSFIQAAFRAMNKPVKEEGKACMDFFKETLSFEAIGRIAAGHYRNAIEERLQKK